MSYYNQNMLSIKSRTTLAELFAEIVLISETIQSYREALADVPYFDSIALFRFIDQTQKGFLCEKDFEKIVSVQHRKLLTYAFSWFDSLRIGQISRLQFAAFLLPRDNLELRQLVAQRVEHPELAVSQPDYILQQFQIFKRLLVEISTRQMKTVQLRRSLMDNSDYSIQGVLNALDVHYHGWICSNDIFQFMKNYGFDVNQRLVQKLTEIINLTFDGKVTLQQLQWTVEGLQSKDKTYLKKIKAANKKKVQPKSIDIQRQIAKHRKQNKKIVDPTPSQKEYQKIIQKFKDAQDEQMHFDKKLTSVEIESNLKNQLDYEQELRQVQLRRQLEAVRRQKERQEQIAKRIMNNQLQEMLLRTNQLQQQAQRLKRIQNRLALQQDAARIRLQHQPAYPLEHQRAFYQPYLLEESRHYRKKLNLTNQMGFDRTGTTQTYKNRSYVGDFGRNNELYINSSIQTHLESSQAYLTAARQIRTKIQREREMDRAVRNKYVSDKYDYSFEGQLAKYDRLQNKLTSAVSTRIEQTKNNWRNQDTKIDSVKNQVQIENLSKIVTQRPVQIQYRSADKIDGVDTTLKLPVSSSKKPQQISPSSQHS